MQAYQLLDSVAGVDELLERSRVAPLVIFKHSTGCSISHLAKARLDRALAAGDVSLPIYYLDLLRHRDVSNHVAERLGVRHESPQVILVDGGEPAYVATHLDIDPYALVAPGPRV